MKILDSLAIISLIGGIILSIFAKELSGIIGWSLALMWASIALFGNCTLNETEKKE